jgi:uncharacterized protein (DUF58 family)
LRPTRRTLLIASLGLPLALLPAVVDARLGFVWPLFLGALAAALGGDALLSPPRGAVSLSAEVPASLFLGERGEAVLAVTMPGPTRPVEVAVDLSDKLAPQPVLAGTVGPGPARLSCPLEARRRGRAAVERASVRYSGPLGLLATTAVFPLDRRIAVLPDLRPVQRAALRLAGRRELGAGLKIERYSGDGSEFDSLREHASGDDPRTVDWKTSAHHGKLLVRQNRAERNHQVIVAVDAGRLMGEPLAGLPRVDRAVEAALLLAYVSLKAGDQVGLYSFGARAGIWAPPRAGIQSFAGLSRLAADVEYGEDETNFTLGLTTLAERLRRRSLVVVLTDFVDTVTAELMVENLGYLARRHAVVFTALRDPDLATQAAAPPVDLPALNRAVVAGSLIEERERVVRRLARLGVRAIDALPDEVSAGLVNAYLDLKRRERI